MTSYRFEPSATFFYEDLFAPDEQPPSPLGAVLARLRAAVGRTEKAGNPTQ